MTCIVAIAEFGNVWMAGDRAAVENSHYLTHSDAPKVFLRGPFLIGYTTSFRMGQLLQYRLEWPQLPAEGDFDGFMATSFVDAVRGCLKDGGYTKIENSREEVGTFLVGVAGRLYYFDDDYNVRRPLGDIAACGSGMSVALGSLHTSDKREWHAPDRLLIALEAASQFVTTVRAPFDVVRLPGA